MPVRTYAEPLSVDLHSTEDALRDLVRQALAVCGMSVKAAALAQGIDISLFSKQLLGREGQISFNRLARLDAVDRRVLDELAFALAESRGHAVRRRNARDRRDLRKAELHRELWTLLAEDDRDRGAV